MLLILLLIIILILNLNYILNIKKYQSIDKSIEKYQSINKYQSVENYQSVVPNIQPIQIKYNTPTAQKDFFKDKTSYQDNQQQIDSLQNHFMPYFTPLDQEQSIKIFNSPSKILAVEDFDNKPLKDIYNNLVLDYKNKPIVKLQFKNKKLFFDHI